MFHAVECKEVERMDDSGKIEYNCLSRLYYNIDYCFEGILNHRLGEEGTDHDLDTLEFVPWSMVKKLDHLTTAIWKF